MASHCLLSRAVRSLRDLDGFCVSRQVDRSAESDSYMPAEEQHKVLLATYFDLKAYMQEYKTTFLWLLYGRHKPLPDQQSRRHDSILKRYRTRSVRSSPRFPHNSTSLKSF
jgi:hypothetical protein